MTQVLYPSVQLKDSLSSACYIREGNELLERGLYLDLQPWSYHVFDLEINSTQTHKLSNPTPTLPLAPEGEGNGYCSSPKGEA